MMAEDAFQRFKDEISEAVSKTLKELNVETEIVIDRAPHGMGDLAFPCFPLAKKLKKSPDGKSVV